MKLITLAKKKVLIVDDEDYDFALRLPVISHTNDTVELRFEYLKKRFSIAFTHLLLKVKGGGQVVVHKNNNRLDCRKENLIVARHSHFNHSIGLNYSKNYPKTSKYRGVSYLKKSNRWKGSIMHLGVRYENTFSTENKAGLFYNKKAKDLYGDHAYQNIIK